MVEGGGVMDEVPEAELLPELVPEFVVVLPDTGTELAYWTLVLALVLTPARMAEAFTPLKPLEVTAPGARAAAQVGGVSVTLPSLPMATLKFQGPLWKTLLAVAWSGNLSSAVQPEAPAGRLCEERFWMERFPLNPPAQVLLTLNMSWSPEGVVPEGGVVVAEVVPDAPELLLDVAAVLDCWRAAKVCAALLEVMTEATQGAPLKIQLVRLKPVLNTPLPLKPMEINELAASPALQLGEVIV